MQCHSFKWSRLQMGRNNCSCLFLQQFSWLLSPRSVIQIHLWVTFWFIDSLYFILYFAASPAFFSFAGYLVNKKQLSHRIKATPQAVFHCPVLAVHQSISCGALLEDLELFIIKHCRNEKRQICERVEVLELQPAKEGKKKFHIYHHRPAQHWLSEVLAGLASCQVMWPHTLCRSQWRMVRDDKAEHWAALSSL